MLEKIEFYYYCCEQSIASLFKYEQFLRVYNEIWIDRVNKMKIKYGKWKWMIKIGKFWGKLTNWMI